MKVDLRALNEVAERMNRVYNNLPHEELARMAKIADQAHRSFEPMLKVVNDPAFLKQMNEVAKTAEKVRRIVEQNHALTLPSIQLLQNMYGTIDREVATATTVTPEKREETITRPFFNTTKTQIRKGITSVKEILPLKLPDETAWEDVQMRFIDPHNVFIEIPKHDVRLTVSYNEMGLWDGRTKLPNAQWTVLRNLATFNGEIAWNTPVANDNVKKQKQLLSKALKRYFNIDSDPFCVYQKEKAYRLKMTLIPDKDIADDNETEEYLSEMAPSIYDSGEF
ncbi:hypothetical protein N8083_00655 [Candidatus Pacebacteria bacterium]|nr:hypothetical protein [Candidatus Paceibacterota bacterium]